MDSHVVIDPDGRLIGRLLMVPPPGPIFEITRMTNSSGVSLDTVSLRRIHEDGWGDCWMIDYSSDCTGNQWLYGWEGMEPFPIFEDHERKGIPT